MNPFWIIGAIGLVAIESSYVPQIVRLYRLKRADDVSLFFPTLNVLGRLLAILYGALSSERVFTTAFMVGILLRGTLCAQVLWYRRLKRKVDSRDARNHLFEVIP
ncbi:MAG: PQ-loop repeat-containing protein [Polyangiaceae bacterium]